MSLSDEENYGWLDHENWDQIHADWMASQIDQEAFWRDFEEEECLHEQAEEEEEAEGR